MENQKCEKAVNEEENIEGTEINNEALLKRRKRKTNMMRKMYKISLIDANTNVII